MCRSKFSSTASKHIFMSLTEQLLIFCHNELVHKNCEAMYATELHWTKIASMECISNNETCILSSSMYTWINGVRQVFQPRTRSPDVDSSSVSEDTHEQRGLFFFLNTAFQRGSQLAEVTHQCDLAAFWSFPWVFFFVWPVLYYWKSLQLACPLQSIPPSVILTAGNNFLWFRSDQPELTSELWFLVPSWKTEPAKQEIPWICVLLIFTFLFLFHSEKRKKGFILWCCYSPLVLARLLLSSVPCV